MAERHAQCVPAAGIRRLVVQIKCTADQFVQSKSFTIKKAWRKNWGRLTDPAYFVVVKVPDDVTRWLDHEVDPRQTLMAAVAYWTRIDPVTDDQSSIQVMTSDRLTIDTLEAWRQVAWREKWAGFGAVIDRKGGAA